MRSDSPTPDSNDPKMEDPTRRKFVRQAATLSAGVVAFGSTVSCGLFDDKEIRVGTLAELKEQGSITMRFNRKKILTRWENESAETFSLVCSHKKCTVAYEADVDQFICPCHDGTYDHAGQVVSGPPEEPLTKFKTEIRGDEVWVVKEKA